MKESKDSLNVLIGEPKRAVRKLSFPLIVGGMAQTLYIFVDGIWVAGLGEKALAAIGLFSPLMMIIISIAMGIGVGCSSSVARALGGKNRTYAETAARTTIILSVLIGIAVGITFYLTIDIIFVLIGVSGETLALSSIYGKTITIGTPLIFFSNAGNSILKGEGDTKRATYSTLTGSFLNIILDPILIYYFKLGILGAALATLISIALTSCIVFYIIFIKRDTYLQIKFERWHFDISILRDIFSVGIPTIFAQISMSITTIILSVFVVNVGGDYGLAVFSGGWRIVSFLTTPLLSMASAITVITGASYGARKFDSLEISYKYSIKLGMVIGLLFGALVGFFAPQVAYLFSYSERSHHLLDGIVEFLRCVIFYFPGIAGNMFTAAMFRGVGKGTYSLIQTVFRTIVMQVIFSYIFTMIFNLGLRGIWISIVIANWSASIVSMMWGNAFINKIKIDSYRHSS